MPIKSSVITPGPRIPNFTGPRCSVADTQTNLSSRPKLPGACGLACRPPKVMKSASVQQPLFLERLPFPLSSRAHPDLLLHSSHRRPLMWFSLKRTTCSWPKPQLSTGNPGEPRDLQFCGPFVEMFFDRGIMGLRPTQGDEKRLLSEATLHRSAALPFVISPEAYPDFLPPRTRNVHVCAFP
jgi:hypothetical protein